MRVSIRDVARHVGVSNVTVSNVLNGHDSRVSAETGERVRQALRELNYIPVPQPVTQGRQVETRTIGLVFDGTAFENIWGMKTFLGLRERALQHDYDLLTLLRQPPGWASGQEELPYLDRRTDALIFVAPYERHEMLQKLGEQGIPIASLFSDDVPQSVPYVDIDNRNALRQSVQHLIQNGHRHILHLTLTDARSDFQHRREGYDQAMREAGITPHVLEVNGRRGNHQLQLEVWELLRHGKFTAVACASDILAYNVQDLLAERGLKATKNISLTGVDDLAESAPRGLTTVRTSCEEVGRRGIDLVLQLLQNKSNPVENITLPVHLVERTSVAAPAKTAMRPTKTAVPQPV